MFVYSRVHGDTFPILLMSPPCPKVDMAPAFGTWTDAPAVGRGCPDGVEDPWVSMDLFGGVVPYHEECADIL